MKRLIRIILFLAFLAGIMYITCPEEEMHVEKLTQKILKSSQSPNSGETNILEDIGNAIVGTISEKATSLYVQNQLKVENHTLLNVGKMKYKGEDRVVTIGAFNHVFCLTKAY